MKMKKISKPWGHEILIEMNKKYMFKELFMKKIIDVVFSTTIRKQKQFLLLKVN